MCCLCAVPLRNGSVQLGTKRHGREGDSNGPADLADNPSNSLGYFQAVRQFKSLFLLLSCYNYLHFDGTDPGKPPVTATAGPAVGALRRGSRELA